MAFFWNLLSLLGGLSLFLFGMNLMGQGLEKRAGARLKDFLARLTSNRFRALLLGIAVTALIQSSSAVTVMAVGFVNSGLLSLSQVTGIVMGANVGTTVTAWLISLTQIEGDGLLLHLFKPTTFTPILAFVGILFYLFSKREGRRTTGTVLLGFAVLMFGMETMSAAVKPLADVPAFGEALLWFQNPLLGVLAGAVLTAILQSSSASIGILQALSTAGQLTLGAAIPIVLGQNIGTCVTTLLSAVGANRNAKRTAFIHLYFNLLGSILLLSGFYLLHALLRFPFVNDTATAFQIALIHTAFNLLATLVLFPLASWLERLAVYTVPEARSEESPTLLDKRLLTSPSLAVARSYAVCREMAAQALSNVRTSFSLLCAYDRERRNELEEREARVDRMEDEIGSYLVSIGSKNMTERESFEITALLHLINDLERISDHALNLAQAAEALTAPSCHLSAEAREDLRVLLAALEEILALTERAFCHADTEAARQVEPLEQTIDRLEEEARQRGVERLRSNRCSLESGFLFSDLLGDLERIADHCSNVAEICLSENEQSIRTHAAAQERRKAAQETFDRLYQDYRARFRLP